MKRFQTRKFKLRIEGANCQFWLMMFADESAMHRYIGRVTGMKTPEDVGDGCCLCNKGSRDIIVCISRKHTNHFIIGHEAFHAATWYAKVNKRKFTRSKWMAIRNGWSDNVDEEEILADVCGSVICEIWNVISRRFKVMEL